MFSYGLSHSVFSILRSKGVYLKERLRPTLELESGSNDPMAYMLTLLLIAYIQSGGMNIWEAGLSLVIQLSVGAIAGFLLGRLAVLIINKIDIDNESFVSDPFIGYGFLHLRRYDLM